MDAIGMSGVTLHSLRHTHASMLIASGVDIITVSRRLGHCSPKVTLEVYGHLINGPLRSWVRYLEIVAFR
jgi:integrase